MAKNGLWRLRLEPTIRVLRSREMTEVKVKGASYMSWKPGDEITIRMAIVQLYRSGMGTQEELARVFDRHVNSIQNYLADYEQSGASGLMLQRTGPQLPWKITPDLRAKIMHILLKEGTHELGGIQRRLEGVWKQRLSVPSIRQVLLENGFGNETAKTISDQSNQLELFDEQNDAQLVFNFEGRLEETELKKTGHARSKDSETAERQREEMNSAVWPSAKRHYSGAQRAYLDRLEEGDFNAYAGGFLFTPFLARYDFLGPIKQLIHIEPYEGYSLEELCQTLFYFDAFGFRSLEDFKRAYPEEFGMLIGRGQSPSLFTLRRFLHKVREQSIGEQLMDAYAVSFLKSEIAKWGVLYIDGHFVPYYGMNAISKGWHGVRQMPMKGSYHFIGVDDAFQPWLFLIRSSREDLLEKIPEMIERAKQIGKQAGISEDRLKQLIIVFDREGYSSKLYRYFDGTDRKGDGERRAIFISWAKYTEKWVYEIEDEKLSQTAEIQYEIRDVETIRYYETERHMNKYGMIRSVVIESGKDKTRMAIYTNAGQTELSSERVVTLMCRRWGEENLIKELLHKHLINYTPGYVFEDLEEQPIVDNPKVRALNQQRASFMREIGKLKVKLADEFLGGSQTKSDLEKMKENETVKHMNAVSVEILLLDLKKDQLQKRIAYDEAHDGKKLVALNYEKKRFLDCVKVFNYNMKRKMCEILLRHGCDRKDVLSVLAMIIERGGYVKLQGGRLQVRLRNFQDRAINYVARHLCEELNGMQPMTHDKFNFPIEYKV